MFILETLMEIFPNESHVLLSSQIEVMGHNLPQMSYLQETQFK